MSFWPNLQSLFFKNKNNIKKLSNSKKIKINNFIDLFN